MKLKEIFVTPSPNELENTENQNGKIAGFWQGLWHGSIAPFTFLISLFKENVGVYESHNNGRWYNFGFIIGLMIVFGCKGAQGGPRHNSKDTTPGTGEDGSLVG